MGEETSTLRPRLSSCCWSCNVAARRYSINSKSSSTVAFAEEPTFSKPCVWERRPCRSGERSCTRSITVKKAWSISLTVRYLPLQPHPVCISTHIPWRVGDGCSEIEADRRGQSCGTNSRRRCSWLASQTCHRCTLGSSTLWISTIWYLRRRTTLMRDGRQNPSCDRPLSSLPGFRHAAAFQDALDWGVAMQWRHAQRFC